MIREEGGVGTTVPHRHAESLAVPDGDVRAPFAGRSQQGQAEQIRGRGHQRTRLVRAFRETPEIADRAVRRRILHQRADHPRLERERLGLAHGDADSPGLGPGAHDGDGLRVAVFVHQKDRVGLDATHRERQAHRLGGGGRFVEQRGVGDRQGREV